MKPTWGVHPYSFIEGLVGFRLNALVNDGQPKPYTSQILKINHCYLPEACTSRNVTNFF